MPFFHIAEEQTYTALLGLFLFAWFLFSAATAILLIVLFIPDHLGLSALLRTLGDLLPTDPVNYTTRMMTGTGYW
jgi:hypothetical protein